MTLRFAQGRLPPLGLRLLPVTVLILLPTTTRTRIISPNLGPNFYGCLFYGNIGTTTARFEFITFIGSVFLAGTVNFFFIGPQFTEIGFFPA
jgi:hypothetical protein